MGFTYDSSMAANGADATWPYTLDYGAVTECGGQTSVCGKKLDAAGLWEVPMYASSGPDGVHLMDPANDFDINSPITASQAAADLLSTFTTHYNGNRAPVGLYLHPVWLGSGVPGIPNGTDKLSNMTKFLDNVLAMPDTWMVTVAQLIEYMKNPVSAADLSSQSYMKCDLKPTANICNGGSTVGIQTCPLSSGMFQVPNDLTKTCFNCPTADPTLFNPVPKTTGSRCPVPDTCDSIYWDPIGCTCLCAVTTGDAVGCGAYKDVSRAINLDEASMYPNGVVPGTGGSKNGDEKMASYGLVALSVFFGYFM